MGVMESETRKRYLTEPSFRAAVDSIRALLHTGVLTTHDVARAVVLACEIHAEQNLGPIVLVLKEDGTVNLEEPRVEVHGFDGRMLGRSRR